MKVITIGRSPENDIIINDNKVSRTHLQIVQDDNGNYSVIDFNSTNGTFVNGQQITGEVRINQGDEVKIGNTVLPWSQSCFSPVQTSIEPSTEFPSTTPRSFIHSKNFWEWAAAAVMVLAIGIGGFIYFNGEKKVESALVKGIEIVDKKQKAKDVEKFNEYYKKADRLRRRGEPAGPTLDSMKQIAKDYPDDKELESKINEFK